MLLEPFIDEVGIVSSIYLNKCIEMGLSRVEYMSLENVKKRMNKKGIDEMRIKSHKLNIVEPKIKG